MILLLAFVFSAILTLVCFVQLLYLESLRLRTREFESLSFFKETLEDRLGLETEQGALQFSLLKHSLLVVCGAALPAAALFQGAGWEGVLEGLVAAWLVMLGATYMVPQVLYRRSNGHWVLPLVPLVRCLAISTKPLALLLGFLESLFELSAPAPGESRSDPNEEIDALISAGEEEGIIEKDDSRLIQNVVAFGDKRVREVMTARREIVAIDVHRSIEELRQLAKEQRYSRILVYDGSIDHVQGFVHVRDLYELDEAERQTQTIAGLKRKLTVVPESMLVAQLLKEMQPAGVQIVGVADEYGRLAGLATMEDLVEEVFGEIRDEHEPTHDLKEEPDGAVTASGNFDADNLTERFGFRRDEDSSATTVGGLACEWYGGVPKVGEVVESHGLSLEILAADDFRVDRVRIRALSPPAAPEGEKE